MSSMSIAKLRSVRDLKFEYNPKAPIGDVRNSPVPGSKPSPKPGPKLLEEQKTQVMSTVMIDDEINNVMAVDRTPAPSKQQEPQEPLRAAAGNPSEKKLKDASVKLVSQHFQQRQEAKEAKQEVSVKYPPDIIVSFARPVVETKPYDAF
uniref:Uncharacterized protein n=1 Tax=Haemonchus contortus TaxID=6289 RepID=A0A7I4XSC2_HAECO